MLAQYHYDDVKYGSVALPMQSDTTEFYTHEIETDKDTLPNFAINQTNLPDSPISFGDMYDAMGQVLSGQIVSPPKGSMRTYTYTLDNKRMLTVGDTGTAVNVIPRSVLQASKSPGRLTRSSSPPTASQLVLWEFAMSLSFDWEEFSSPSRRMYVNVLVFNCCWVHTFGGQLELPYFLVWEKSLLRDRHYAW
jgi:hypothetical protein